MRRRRFNQAGTVAVFWAALGSCFGSTAKKKIGHIGIREFRRANEGAALRLKAVNVTSKTLSESDIKLMRQINACSHMQLELSALAVRKTASTEVRMLAEAEVEEQSVLIGKIQEFGSTKKFLLPPQLHPRTTKILRDLRDSSRTDFNKLYLIESGIHGHELLHKIMTQVKTTAKDPDLILLATTILPLIEIHVQVFRSEALTIS